MNEHIVQKWRWKYEYVITYVHALHYVISKINILSDPKEESLYENDDFFYYLKILQLFLSIHCSFIFLSQTGIEDEKLCISQPPFQLFDPDLQLPYQAAAFRREQVTWT